MPSASQDHHDEVPLNVSASRPEHDPYPAAQGAEALALTPATLLNGIQDAVILTDLAFRITGWNPAAEALYGWSAAEAIGQLVDELLQIDYLGAERAQRLAQLQDDGVWKGDVRHHHRDGHAILILATVSWMRDPNGAPIGALSLNRALSERTPTAAALREHELSLTSAIESVDARIGTLFDMLPVGVAILDADHAVVYANPALSHILRLEQAGLLQRSYQQRQYLRTDGTPMAPDAFASVRALREQQPITDVETGIVTETGEVIWTSVSAAPVNFPDWRVLVVTIDITARKRAEQAMQRATERLHILADVSRAFIEAGAEYQALLDRIVQICAERLQAACSIRLLSADGQGLDIAAVGHYDPARLVDMRATLTAWRINLDDRAPAAVATRTGEPQFIPVIDREALPATIPPEQREVLQRFFPHSLIVTPLRLHNRSIGSLMFARDESRLPAFDTDDLSLAQDLTDRAALVIGNAQLIAQLRDERALLARRVEERTADLSLLNAELARANRLKDEFLASMSHELRTPLNAILGRAEALQEAIYGPVTPEQIVAFQGIDESGRHLLALINDILDLSKIEAGRLDLETEPLQIDLLGPLCLRMVAQTALSKRISLSSLYDSQVQMLVADERRLKQILVNLLSNAVKFTPKGGQVGLELRGDAAAQRVTFTVWDSGIGIAAEDLPKLFQPFVQLDSSLSRQYTGTGLGLALVARLAKAHGGSVAVESTPGAGSRFHVTLPWQPDAVLERSIPESLVLPSTRPMIGQAMVVEDSPTAAAQLARYLHELGARVEVLPHGTGVIARAIALQPDVILLDILLPDDDGWQVLRQLKAEPLTQAIPVIIVSVVDQPERARAMGAAASLLKPINRVGVEQILRRVLIRQEEAFVQLALVATPTAGRPKLLLAEDNEATIATFTDYLQAKGYDLVIARNGSDAVMRAQEERPDAILMDIQMPGMDGLEAIRRIRADTGLAQVPIIAVTALTMPGDRERCLAAGADDYLTKPVQLQRLVATIEALRGERG
jgi:PAS domain S-box-containing protein